MMETYGPPCRYQRWSRGHKANYTNKIRGQGQRQLYRGQTLSRPRTGMLEANTKDQGHRCKCFPNEKKFFQAISPPKKGLQKNFYGDLQNSTTKKSLRKFSARFLAFSNRILTMQIRVLSSSRSGQAVLEDLRLRGQGQRLDLRGQRLQNVSLRTSSRPRMS